MNQLFFRRQWRKTIFPIVSLLSLSVNAALPFVAAAQDDVENTQDDIRRVEKKLEAATKKKKTLEQNLNQVNASLSVAIAAVRKTQAAILDTKDSITRAALEIELTDQQITLKQAVLADLVREAYLRGSESTADIVLSEETLSETLDTSTQFATIGSRIGGILDDMERLKEDREAEKSALEAKKKESEEALAKKNAEKAALAQNQSAIAQDVAEQTATIGELQKKLAELESDLNTLTGKSYDAKDIKDAVEFASDKTGVPKGVLYGFLKMETNLGVNTGQCTYKEVEKVAVARYKKYGSKYKASIALLYKRQDIFYDLVDALGYSKNKKVSCSPSGYIGQGGAMGVSQFMSDVWQGYSSEVASKTGHKTPDPWNLTDGVMAMAIKLRKAGATSDKESVIKKASINYLGTFYSNYYNGIVYWSKNYQKLFD